MSAAHESRIVEILNRPYSWVVTREEDGRYSAKVLELPGCVSQGDSRQEALANLADVAYEWVKGAIEDGFPIPDATEREVASGRFLLRLPRTVHARLQSMAERDGVSLNQYVVSVLSGHVGAAQLATEIKAQIAAGLTQITHLLSPVRALLRASSQAATTPRIVIHREGDRLLTGDFGPPQSTVSSGQNTTSDYVRLLQ